MTAHLDVDLGAGVILKLVRIDAGKFLMGSPQSEQDQVRETDNSPVPRDCSEEKQHEVEITRPFYLGVYQVTQAEYERVMGTNPSWFSPAGGGQEVVAGRATSSLSQALAGVFAPLVDEEVVAPEPGVALDSSRFPVESVSWEEALAFCRALSRKEGRPFDLPTEAEWEYACRAGTTGPFHCGATLSSKQANFVDEMRFYDPDRGPPLLGRTTQVGTYEPNAFGLYDMHGNVCEYCRDWYAQDYYDASPARDPQGPAGGDSHALRGGSWSAVAAWCRSAAREADFGGRNEGWGFRVVLRLP